VFLLKCSVAQQEMVTASKIGSKNRLFQQTQLFMGSLISGNCVEQNQAFAGAVSSGFLGKLTDSNTMDSAGRGSAIQRQSLWSQDLGPMRPLSPRVVQLNGGTGFSLGSARWILKDTPSAVYISVVVQMQA
jgi:hypothetical protein